MGAAHVETGAANAAPYSFSATPIGAPGSLPPGGTAQLTLTLTGPGGSVPAACGAGADDAFAWLSLSGGGSAAAAQISGGTSTMVPLGPAPQLFQGDASGHIAISYTAPAGAAAAGLDTITAANLPTGATATVSDSYQHQPQGSSSSPPGGGSSPAPPVIGSLTVTPRSLPRSGGTVQVSWTAQNARSCSLTASRAGRTRSSLSGIPCSAGTVTRQLRFPRDRRRHRELYRLTVMATGAAGHHARGGACDGAGQPPGQPASPAGRGSRLPVLLLLLGFVVAACAAVLLGRHYYRRRRRPAPPQQVQAVPHGGPPGPVAVRQAGQGASLVVRVEAHHDPGRTAIRDASSASLRAGAADRQPGGLGTGAGGLHFQGGGLAVQDARAIDFADADTITFTAADRRTLADAGSRARTDAESVALADADTIAIPGAGRSASQQERS